MTRLLTLLRQVAPAAELCNIYGPTECTIWCTNLFTSMREFDESEPTIPIGPPSTQTAPTAPFLPKQPLRPPSYQSSPYGPNPTQAAPTAPLPPQLAAHACLTLWLRIRSTWYCTSISPPGLTNNTQPPPASTPAYSATEKSKLMEALRTHTSLGDTSYLSRK